MKIKYKFLIYLNLKIAYVFEVIFIAITTREAIFNHLVNSQQLNFRSI
jgi:hypothetical protein